MQFHPRSIQLERERERVIMQIPKTTHTHISNSTMSIEGSGKFLCSLIIWINIVTVKCYTSCIFITLRFCCIIIAEHHISQLHEFVEHFNGLNIYHGQFQYLKSKIVIDTELNMDKNIQR